MTALDKTDVAALALDGQLIYATSPGALRDRALVAVALRRKQDEVARAEAEQAREAAAVAGRRERAMVARDILTKRLGIVTHISQVVGYASTDTPPIANAIATTLIDGLTFAVMQGGYDVDMRVQYHIEVLARCTREKCEFQHQPVEYPIYTVADIGDAIEKIEAGAVHGGDCHDT